MKIRLAILDDDQIYLKRLAAGLTAKYPDQLVIYSFTDKEVALAQLEENKIVVFLAGENFNIDTKSLPSRVGFAYLVDNPEIESFRSEDVVCKYQKADLIYSQILSIFSENSTISLRSKIGGSKTEIYSFTSAAGGVGTSSIAAAFAKNLAERGKEVLYLDLGEFGNADLFFEGEGNFSFGDIIYALKSKKTNLGIKMESSTKRDLSGVSFFSSPNSSLDIAELKLDEIDRLIDEVAISAKYDFLILDTKFSLDEVSYGVYRFADMNVFVSDGSEISNYKTKRAIEALKLLSVNDDSLTTDKAYILYNGFSSKLGRMIEEYKDKKLGGTPRFEYGTTKQVVNELAKQDVFQAMLDRRL